MSVLVTGVAGFIGMHTAQVLLERGEHVVGVDILNNYYDPALKHARLWRLKKFENFCFEKLDFATPDAIQILNQNHPKIDRVIHLGAQAGVRYSIDNPDQYLHSNLCGQLTILEFCRSKLTNSKVLKNFVYASSSSVYGSNKQVPFSVENNTDNPVSFYGATKKAGEIMVQSYSHLYQIPSIGLRFFTVYGPWGRPDMSPYIFTKSIYDTTAFQPRPRSLDPQRHRNRRCREGTSQPDKRNWGRGRHRDTLRGNHAGTWWITGRHDIYTYRWGQLKLDRRIGGEGGFT